MKKIIYTALLGIAMVSCGGRMPSDCTASHETAPIYPDYTEVTVPPCIAPLNFLVKGADRCVAEFKDASGNTLTVSGKGAVKTGLKEWRKLLEASEGGSVTVTVAARTDGKWLSYEPFSIYVAEDDIDPYISYRLIEPSYVAYEDIYLKQRDITSFREHTFFTTVKGKQEGVNQCANCHSFQNYSTENMLFHIRGQQGGTMMIKDGEARLLQMKRPGMVSATVYPSWHPTLPVVAFSTNVIKQIFHTHDNAKVEVQEEEGRLVLYDVNADRIIPVESDTADWETFPTWSADGTKLYYSAARYERHDTTVVFVRDLMTNYQEVRYNLYERDFDPVTMTLGPRRLLLEMADRGMSATLARANPNGRYLIYARGGWGCFQIWHPDADIAMLDLETGEERVLSVASSDKADSYPVWSSNGRWIAMESRRDDSNYTRLYISYFDKDGNEHKAFQMPERNPGKNLRLLKSYNRPEFTVDECGNFDIF